jgi:hypothetical protein
MTDADDFLAWVRTALYEAELAVHNGDTARSGGTLVPQRTGKCSGRLAQRLRTAGAR